MNKHDWKKPEIMELGLKNTKEGSVDERGLLIHKCDYCGKIFLSHSAEKNHEKSCIKKPASPGFGPNGDVTPGLDALIS